MSMIADLLDNEDVELRLDDDAPPLTLVGDEPDAELTSDEEYEEEFQTGSVVDPAQENELHFGNDAGASAGFFINGDELLALAIEARDAGLEHAPADAGFDVDAEVDFEEDVEYEGEVDALEADDDEINVDEVDAPVEVVGEVIPQKEIAEQEIKHLDSTPALFTEEEVLELFDSHKRRYQIRDWELTFGGVSAPANTVLTFTESPQCYFRGEKVMAIDTATPAGSGTRIMGIFIGQKFQRPAGGGQGSLTSFFPTTSLGNGAKWDLCHPHARISVVVSFVQAVTFDMSVFGKSAV